MYLIHFILIFFLQVTVANQTVNDLVKNKIKEVETQQFQKIIVPELPSSLSFAGEPVPLEDADIRERLERELINNCYKHSATLIILKREGKWKARIQAILKEQGIPEDFFYLAVAESELDEYALSPAKALGFWQFLKETGKEFGLEINNYVDQRKDPIASTYAACKYLKAAYEKYGRNWTLAAASYNRGMNGLKKALEAQKVDSYYDLYLNRETYRYVLRILALKAIMENPSKYGFHIEDEQRWKAVETERVWIDSTINNLPEFAKQMGINYKTLKIHNPWLDSEDYNLVVQKGKGYWFEIPKTKN
ncbi:MAG: lytic transglycosylase domain-containing protein [Thermoflexibacter sp.]